MCLFLNPSPTKFWSGLSIVAYGEVLTLYLKYSANTCTGSHSDVYNMTGAHPMDVNIAGHEGVGEVVQLGTNARTLSIGQRVGIKWIHETCGVCEICKRDSTLCPLQHNSGRDRDGTLQQYQVVPEKHATPIPDGVSSEIAAPLLCGEFTSSSQTEMPVDPMPNHYLCELSRFNHVLGY